MGSGRSKSRKEEITEKKWRRTGTGFFCKTNCLLKNVNTIYVIQQIVLLVLLVRQVVLLVRQVVLLVRQVVLLVRQIVLLIKKVILLVRQTVLLVLLVRQIVCGKISSTPATTLCYAGQ